MLKTKAIHQNGGCELGKQAVEDAVNAGIWEEKIVTTKGKDGKKVTVTHVRVTEAVESEGNTKSFKSKVRGGGDCSLEDFGKQAMDMLMPGEASQLGPPKGGEAGVVQLALEDGPQEPPSKRQTSVQQQPACMKKPAGA